MRARKRLYYSNLLHNNKNNIQKVWGILNTVIKGNKYKNSYPDCFIEKNNDHYKMDEVVNSFYIFVNVGPDLADIKSLRVMEMSSTTHPLKEI